MIGKLIPAGTGFEPGQFSEHAQSDHNEDPVLEGRVPDLFGDEIDDIDLFIDDASDELFDDLIDDVTSEEDIDDSDDDDDFEEEETEDNID